MTTTEPTHSRGSILLVDDLPENLQLLSELLIQLGYNIRSVTSGKMALKTLAVKQPDLILLDIKMPEMDGYQVCAAIKKDENLRDIPIIFISALDDKFDKVKAFACGGVDYISKPFEIEEVVARVENQLTIQRQKIALQQEVKKRQEIEEVLYQSRALLSSVLNSALDGIAALQAVRDLQGNIADFRCLVVNPIIARVFQKQREELIGKLIFKKFIQRVNPAFFDRIITVVETGESIEGDFYYLFGESSWYHFVAVKLGDGFAITVRDITARKKMELELQQANKELQQQNQTLAENVKLREDIENITRHDLKTPLNAIISYPQIMLMDDNLTTEQYQHLEDILKAGNEMLTMINNSLHLLKMETGCYHYHPQPVDLLSVIQRIIKNLQILITSYQVNFKILINGKEIKHGQSFFVLAEESLSYSLFANLISNAIEASPINGLIIIAMDSNDENGIISITNSGSVPETIQKTFFEKYTTVGKARGTGLGTYSAKLMAETQNGDIAMKTNSTETCITVRLPTWI